ncbi:hypothetical protein ABEF95_010461 [Exophiala dermatitidis]
MVYFGPSGGCKTCRTRRVKCDQTKPHCNNCVRRHQTCPGYGDVFDAAHRSENNVVLRRIERQNAAQKKRPSNGTPSRDRSIVPSTLKPSPLVSPRGSGIALCRVNSSSSSENASVWDESDSSTSMDGRVSNNFTSIVPGVIRQDPKEASICFFFHYYTGIVHDPQAKKSFTKLWQPMYHHSSADSPLRHATAAVTVNIAMMWNFQGCDSPPARRLYAKAISSTREALATPSKTSLDELLMTILLFDLYEALLAHYLPELPQSGGHKQGALALLKLRGASNYATELGRELVTATRNALLHHALSWRVALPPGAEEHLENPLVEDTRITQLDKIGMEIVDVQSRLWSLKREAPLARSPIDRRQEYEKLIAEAVTIDTHLLTWKRSITFPHWHPHYLRRDEVTPSIVAAGFYGQRCSVWHDLAFSNIWNEWHRRRLLTLQMIRDVSATEPRIFENHKYRAILDKANADMQASADAICESVPCHLGDTVVPTNPVHSHEINFPYKDIVDQQTGQTIRIPTDANYKTHAAASGGWVMFARIVVLYRLAEPEDDALPLVLREGQLDWIKAQIKRLQTIFLFCNPVWFKRLPQGRGTTTFNIES